jgi:GNAT superfamily N-acetyltransferase
MSRAHGLSFVQGSAPDDATFLAVSDGKVVGTLTVGPSADGNAADAADAANAANAANAADGRVTPPAARRTVTLRDVTVAEAWRGRGVGRFLVSEWLRRFPREALRAEADEEAMGFFHSLGFRVRPLDGASDGRYECLFDDTAWEPLPYREAAAAFAAAGVTCWVAGGWALDLFQGRQTRPHEDTDVLMLRDDQERLFDAFPGWEIYRTHAPSLAHWNGVPFLDATPNVWLRRTGEEPWALEAMFLDVEGAEWFYRRDRRIHGAVADVGLVTPDGIPYLRPEIQLLFKGGASVLREKDTRDLLEALPLLPAQSRAWLAAALRRQFPQGHEWLRLVEPR